MLDLALGDQVPDCGGDLLDRNVRIDTVLVEEVDGVDAQRLERVLRDLADAFRAAVEPAGCSRTKVEAKLRGDDDFVSEWLQGLADEFFVGERTVDFGGVKERDAARPWCTDTVEPAF